MGGNALQYLPQGGIRNVNNNGGGDYKMDEMDKEDMVMLSPGRCNKRGRFCSAVAAASVDVISTEIDGALSATATAYSGSGEESTSTGANKAPLSLLS